jgi:hypothetical protein
VGPLSALFEVTLDQTLGNCYHFIKLIRRFKNLLNVAKNKVKLSLLLALEVHGFLRRRVSHILYKVGSQLAVTFSPLLVGGPLSPKKFLVLISVRGLVDSRAIVRLDQVN